MKEQRETSSVQDRVRQALIHSGGSEVIGVVRKMRSLGKGTRLILKVVKVSDEEVGDVRHARVHSGGVELVAET